MRRIFGAKQINGTWQVRKNSELQQLYASPDLVGEVKGKRLDWAGHVVRMVNERSVQKLFLGRPEKNFVCVCNSILVKSN